jgi:Holliday junction resolvase
MPKTEQDIQRECLSWLTDNGYLAWKQPSQGLRVAGGRRVKNKRATTVGHPDIMALKEGVFYCIEVKKPGGKLAQHQIAWLTYAEVMGAVCCVTTNVDHMIQSITNKSPFSF